MQNILSFTLVNILRPENMFRMCGHQHFFQIPTLLLLSSIRKMKDHIGFLSRVVPKVRCQSRQGFAIVGRRLNAFTTSQP